MPLGALVATASLCKTDSGERVHLLCGSVKLRFYGLNLWITFVYIIIELIQFDKFYALSLSTYNSNIPTICYGSNHNFFSHCDNNLIYYKYMLIVYYYLFFLVPSKLI